MADYNYDEGGVLAAYFLITFLALILVPLTLSLSSSKKNHSLSGCQCQPCIEQRARNSQRDKGSLLNPKLSKKHIFLIVGWSILAALCYRVAGAKLETTVYDPFEILGLSSSSTEKEIKKHYRKLALKFHPDKVKLAANQTAESVSSYFTELTKAYKALTDEDIRENLRKWGHPDGRQPTSTGIALPKWVIEGHNNKWVLGLYGILFGGALPAIVGRWWFGSRQKTKDGIHAQSAATFFKGLKEDASIADVVHILAQAYQYELPAAKVPADAHLAQLEKAITSKLGEERWKPAGKISAKTRVALVLLYAHMLRLDVPSPALQKLQTQILLHAPTLVNAMFNICTSRNWLTATLSIVRAFPYLIQAVEPGSVDHKWTQLPGVSESESQSLHAATDLEEVVSTLEKNEDAKKAVSTWGNVELVDATYKVIDERVVVPASIVYLVVKLRLTPPNSAVPEEPSVDETKRRIKVNDAKDAAFLEGRDELEPLSDDLKTIGYAHAPHWPADRKPTWWLILADEKSNRIVVPPTKITEIPYANARQADGRDYRSYKFQFQAPQGTGLFTWKIYVVSDTYIGHEVKKDMPLRIEDASVLETDDGAEDEISDPDEDTLAGQMALMKGGKVKKAVEDDSDDDESDTDGDESSGSSSDSD